MIETASNENSASNREKRSFNTASPTFSEVSSELIIKYRIRYGNKSSACRGLMAEYSKSSSIHGIRYVFEVHRPLYEKVVWIVLILASLYVAGALIWDTYLKWLDSPVILIFDESLVPVHQIPFPTVTICPEIKMETERFDFTQVSQKIWLEIEEYSRFNNVAGITDEELKHFVATLQICENDVLARFAPYLLTHDREESVASIIFDLALEHNRTLLYSKWNNRFYTSSDHFKYVLTEEGLCHQFNGLDTPDIYRDPRYLNYYDNATIIYNDYFPSTQPKFNNITGSWSLEGGYVNQGFNAYPQRSVLSSVRNGLAIAMVGLESNFEYSCRSYKQGYKVFINSPDSVPLTTGNYIQVRHDYEMLIALLPRVITSALNLRDIDLKKRQCYFNHERYLRFFKSYSQNNCEIECLTNFTISQCGCAKFWMPKPEHVPVCGLADAVCFTTAADEIRYLIANETKQNFINSKAKVMCDCMPSCTSLDYDFEIIASSYDLQKAVSAQRDKYDHNDAHGSRLSIYFKESQFPAIKRNAVHSLTTLIANCGGILGLFLGVSGLSIVELFYFFTMRYFSNMYKRRMIRKSLRLELSNFT